MKIVGSNYTLAVRSVSDDDTRLRAPCIMAFFTGPIPEDAGSQYGNRAYETLENAVAIVQAEINSEHSPSNPTIVPQSQVGLRPIPGSFYNPLNDRTYFIPDASRQLRMGTTDLSVYFDVDTYNQASYVNTDLASAGAWFLGTSSCLMPESGRTASILADTQSRLTRSYFRTPIQATGIEIFGSHCAGLGNIKTFKMDIRGPDLPDENVVQTTASTQVVKRIHHLSEPKTISELDLDYTHNTSSGNSEIAFSHVLPFAAGNVAESRTETITWCIVMVLGQSRALFADVGTVGSGAAVQLLNTTISTGQYPDVVSANIGKMRGLRATTTGWSQQFSGSTSIRLLSVPDGVPLESCMRYESTGYARLDLNKVTEIASGQIPKTEHAYNIQHRSVSYTPHIELQFKQISEPAKVTHLVFGVDSPMFLEYGIDFTLSCGQTIQPSTLPNGQCEQNVSISMPDLLFLHGDGTFEMSNGSWMSLITAAVKQDALYTELS